MYDLSEELGEYLTHNEIAEMVSGFIWSDVDLDQE